jgi:hypothetical protein
MEHPQGPDYCMKFTRTTRTSTEVLAGKRQTAGSYARRPLVLKINRD